MGLEFMESGTPYALTDINSLLRRWTQAFSTGILEANNTGRTNRAIRIGAGGTISKTLTHKNSWTIGWAFKMEVGSSIGSNDIYQGFNVGTRLFYVRLEADGTFTLRTPTTIMANSTFSILTNNFYYFEVKYTLSGDPISVTAEMRVNGNVIASGSGPTGVTQASLIHQDSTVNRHTFGTGGTTTNLCDMVLLSNEDYWGDVVLGRIMPNGDVTTDWSTTGSPSYSQVNEVPPNDDTSYISSNTAGQKDLFDWEDIPAFSGAIKGIQYSICARKDGEGSRSIFHTVGAPGSELTVLGPFYVDDTYVYYHVPMETDPTAGAWTRASFNAQRFGVLLNS